jgi:hypothetical protein
MNGGVNIVNAGSDYLLVCANAGYTSSSFNAPLYTGKFTSLVYNSASLDQYCIGANYVSQSGAESNIRTSFTVTRSAQNANKASHSWTLTTAALLNTTIVSVPNTVAGKDITQNNKYVVSPILLYRSTADKSTFGSVRGTLHNAVYIGSYTASGWDTFEVDGVTYLSNGTAWAYRRG